MKLGNEILLPSGAKLKVQPAPFAASKVLYQAVLEEAKDLKFAGSTEIENVMKDLFCVGFSSKKIEQALLACMDRALYNGSKITESTFEDVDKRQDYPIVCFEVAHANVYPFMKNLSALSTRILESLPKSPA